MVEYSRDRNCSLSTLAISAISSRDDLRMTSLQRESEEKRRERKKWNGELKWDSISRYARISISTSNNKKTKREAKDQSFKFHMLTASEDYYIVHLKCVLTVHRLLSTLLHSVHTRRKVGDRPPLTCAAACLTVFTILHHRHHLTAVPRVESRTKPFKLSFTFRFFCALTHRRCGCDREWIRKKTNLEFKDFLMVF